MKRAARTNHRLPLVAAAAIVRHVKLSGNWLTLGLLSFVVVVQAFSPLSSRHEKVHHHYRHWHSLNAAADDTDADAADDDVLLPTLTKPEIARYSRHLVLGDVGMSGQRRLKRASCLVIGAGGLGSPCLLYLAAAGVGHIGIVDADVVDTSNLQRQIIHGSSTVGVSKCQSAAQRLRDVNPHVAVRLYETEFTSETALDIVQQGFFSEKETKDRRPYDIVVDGSDNFPTKYLINDVCAMLGIPWVYSAILAFEGQLSFFNLPLPSADNDSTTSSKSFGPDYRDLLPTPPPPGDVPSCAEGGVLGVLPGTMGCLQATEVIKYLLGRQHWSGLLSGRVLVMDALQMKFSQIGLSRAANRTAITELIDYQGFCAGPKSTTTTAASSSSPTTTSSSSATTSSTTPPGRTMDEVETEKDASAILTATKTFHSLSPQECLDKLVHGGWSPWVLDVRLPTEHDIVALPFTDQVVPHRVVQARRHVPKQGDVLVYCKAGVRGKKACLRLMEQGVDPDRLYNLEGGIMKWQADVDPSMARY